MDREFMEAEVCDPPQLERTNFTDDLLYIYTSGTTGLPKAAHITHSRAIFMASSIHHMIKVRENDVVYDPLPLSHSSGGILGVGQALLFGCTTVLRRRFSVKSYWSDAVKYHVTVGMYIGEICRYLLLTSYKPEETQHEIRMMFGNGLRMAIWEDFRDRFKIDQMCEFYGSTEGNANLVNTTGKTGAVGFLTRVAPWVYPVALLKCDPVTGEPMRNTQGLCMRCKPGEVGQLTGKIIKNDPTRDFHGYLDQEATKSVIVRDVFQKGDHAFLTGDLLVMDSEGYLYFKERLGDTFRWKGENVSTMEVENAISATLGSLDVVVYGVEVAGREGKAGMAAIVDRQSTLDLPRLYSHLNNTLPPHAHPIFIRITSQIEVTETLKMRKKVLQQEGFDPSQIADQLFFLDRASASYVPLTLELCHRIINAEVQL